ncbi:MAG TPA: hypothetical protein VM282_23845 [Acidimicrobiales bacterium]|nr:hypothetical protein [Acidimicrobiales bacterium]
MATGLDFSEDQPQLFSRAHVSLASSWADATNYSRFTAASKLWKTCTIEVGR